jgi:putative drug exporter of the RND superfamily
LNRWQWLARVAAGRFGKWVVLGCWLAILVVAAPLAGRIGDVTDNDETNWLPHGAESTRAVHLAEREFPAADTTPLVVVYSRDGGITPADRQAVAADRAALARLADGAIQPPVASADGAALLLTAPVSTARMEHSDNVEGLVDRARSIIDDGLPAGLTARTTGPVASRADSIRANGQINGPLGAITIGVVALLLLVTYRSPLLLFVPLLSVVLAAVLAQGCIELLAAHAGLVVSGSSSFLLTIVVFGVGTDYALLLTSRYREELRQHRDRHQAMALALRRTIPSVLASAATVMLAALTLLAAEMNSTRGLGPVTAVAVAAALLAMTTLLPALLVIFGRWPFWPAVPHFDPTRTPPASGTGLWAHAAALIDRWPRRIWVATALLLAILTSGTAALHVGGVTPADNFTRKPESLLGQQVVNEHFPAGSTAPTDLYAPSGTAAAVAEAARSTSGVAAVRPAGTSATGQWTRLSAVLAAPPASPAAQQTVQRLRDATHHVDPAALVGGSAATTLDTNRAMDRDLAVVVPVILAVVILVLGALLRAVVAPLLLLACVLLSAGAAVGGAALLFNTAGFPRTDQSVLLLGLLFLVALGVDYTIFLMGRAREEVTLRGHRPGVLRALTTTGGVITSAGLVLAATFSVFTITPVVLNVQLGALVALGVLIDTFVVRSLFVPALALEIGPRIWWPSHLTTAHSETSRRPPTTPEHQPPSTPTAQPPG